MKPTILGLAASLRNARWGSGNSNLLDNLRALGSEDELKAYLKTQAELHLQNFVDSGRAQGLDFAAIHANLKAMKGDRGLSNSEVALAAALWSAHRAGCEIAHVSLAEFFPAADVSRRLDELKAILRRADGILLSGPVYFGDRGSLAHELVNLIRNDAELGADLENKVYAGIAVGAKRNGGQETTLIYQLLDMVHTGLLGVGNDSDTTSQYGGTGHAGDVGTMPADQYGLWTSMGTGRRVAHVAQLLGLGRRARLRGKVRVLFWILQDQDAIAGNYLRGLLEPLAGLVEPTIIDATARHVTRCLACDICPTHVDRDDSYRCIIKTPRDGFVAWHESFLEQDAVVPVALSPVGRERLQSNYQTFIERTRYLRRGDYLFSDLLTAPLVLEELGAHENLSVRMVTSMIRHHTVMAEPMIAYLHSGRVLNAEGIGDQFRRFINRAATLAAGRLASFVHSQQAAGRYNPVGYILSADKDREDEKLQVRATLVAERHRRLAEDAEARLVLPASTAARKRRAPVARP